MERPSSSNLDGPTVLPQPFRPTRRGAFCFERPNDEAGVAPGDRRQGPEGRVSLGSEYRRACAASAPRRSPRTLAVGGRPRPSTSRQLRASQGHPSLRPPELNAKAEPASKLNPPKRSPPKSCPPELEPVDDQHDRERVEREGQQERAVTKHRVRRALGVELA